MVEVDCSDSSVPFEVDTAYSLFQSYIQTLSSEHRAVDTTLVEAQDTLRHQSQAAVGQRSSRDSSQERGELHSAKSSATASQRTLQECKSLKEENGFSQERQEVLKECALDGGCSSTHPVLVSEVGSGVHQFREETDEVRSAVEQYSREQQLLEEKLTLEQRQREVHFS